MSRRNTKTPKVESESENEQSDSEEETETEEETESENENDSESESNRKYDVTFNGLNKWHDHMFTHLGWMILAQEHGYSDKINTYKRSIERLAEAIIEKLESTENKDRKEDLKILLKNTKILMKHANKDFR